MRDFLTLRNVLWADAASCLGMAALLLSAAGPIGRWTALPPGLLVGAGVVLLPVVGFVAWLALRRPVPGWGVSLLVAGNVLWAVTSVLLPAAGQVAPNALGWALLLGQAGFVAALAWLEAGSRPVALAA